MATGLEQQLIKGARFAAGPVVPIGSIAAAGFEKGQKAVKDIEAKQIEARKAEAEAWAKKRQDAAKNWTTYFDKLSTTNSADKISDLPTEKESKVYYELIERSKQSFLQYLSPDVSNVQRSVGYNNINQNIDQMMADIKSVPEKIAEWGSNLQNVSVANSSMTIDRMAASLNDSEWDHVGDGKIVFKNKNFGETNISKLHDVDYIPVATEAFVNKVTELNALTEKFAKQNTSKANLKEKLNNELADLNITKNEAISIVYDFLGKEQPGYVSIEIRNDIAGDLKKKPEAFLAKYVDTNKNKDIEASELNSFIKDQLIAAAEDGYEERLSELNKDDISEVVKTETDIYSDAKSLMQSIYDGIPGAIGGKKTKENIEAKKQEELDFVNNSDLTEEKKKARSLAIEEKYLEQETPVSSLIELIKNEPIMSGVKMEDPEAKKSVLKTVTKKELGFTDEEFEEYYNEKYGDVLMFIDDKPVNSIDAILDKVYGRGSKLPAGKRLNNTQMKSILNSLFAEEDKNFN
jgi:hypothetical protein